MCVLDAPLYNFFNRVYPPLSSLLLWSKKQYILNYKIHEALPRKTFWGFFMVLEKRCSCQSEVIRSSPLNLRSLTSDLVSVSDSPYLTHIILITCIRDMH